MNSKRILSAWALVVGAFGLSRGTPHLRGAESRPPQGDAWSFNSHELFEEGGRLCRQTTFYTHDEYRTWTEANPGRTK